MGSCLSAESRSPRPVTPSSNAFGAWKRKNSKKRSGSQNSSFDYRKEGPLHRIPGRLFLNGSSDIASLFTQQGRKGINQDAMIVWENFFSRKDTVFCGVFDGHGPYGHMVAKRVRDSLPLKLSAHWDLNTNSEDTNFISADEESRASVDLEENEKHPAAFERLKESFLKAFKVMDRELRMHTTFDCFCSGTTAVTLVKQGKYLVIGNVGDSRAVLGTRDKDDSVVAVQLTVDLKPNLPAEAERIRKCKGRVFALEGEPEVARVWLPNNDSPGLAMARAFGDFCLKDFGLISVPDIFFWHITEGDEFVILATDGIWDVLSNKEVADIVASVPARGSAARVLVESAVRAWKYKYPTSKVDDCAAVCLFFDSKSNLNRASNARPKEKEEEEKDPSPGPTRLDRTGTVQNGEEVVSDTSAKEESLKQDCGSGMERCALERVLRGNTLLDLPRFVPGKEDRKVAKNPK